MFAETDPGEGASPDGLDEVKVVEAELLELPGPLLLAPALLLALPLTARLAPLLAPPREGHGGSL